MWHWIKLLLVDPNCIIQFVRPKLLADPKFHWSSVLNFGPNILPGPWKIHRYLFFIVTVPRQSWRISILHKISKMRQSLARQSSVTDCIWSKSDPRDLYGTTCLTLIYFRVNKLSISIPNPQKSNSILKLNFPNFVYFLGFVAKINLW